MSVEHPVVQGWLSFSLVIGLVLQFAGGLYLFAVIMWKVSNAVYLRMECSEEFIRFLFWRKRQREGRS